MTPHTPPYFFDEAERASAGKQPGDPEKALGFTIADLTWLRSVYLASQAARQAKARPMYVYRLKLGEADANPVTLAGAFAMSHPKDGEVTLYTPWKGLIKFADITELKSQLSQWLAQSTGQRELLRLLSIEQRHALTDPSAVQIHTELIEGAVFQDQELCLESNQAQNLKTMIGELLKFPTLQTMLDESLKNALLKRFPGLNQRHTRMNCVINSGSVADGSNQQYTSASLSLSEAVLHYYLNNRWPAGDARLFTHPRHGVSSAADNQAWQAAVKEIAQSLTPHLQSLLETFWNDAMSTGQSRRAFFAEAMRDTFHTRLLLQRQSGVVSTPEYLHLSGVSLKFDIDPALRVETVRISAPLKHYVILASTLMIGSRDSVGFLYTQSRGLEATQDLAAVKTVVLDMLKSPGHEDTLLNFMSLDERGTFLGFEPSERLVAGEPVTGAAFEQLLESVLDKQRANLSHALNRYRDSDGAQDPHALLDNALDVRGLIDDRLLTAEVDGRWSTHADQRWSAQPATVRGESAKEQLTRLSTVRQALDQRLDSHPLIPATTRTVGEAQALVDSSIQQLQVSFTHTLSAALRSELNLRTVTRSLNAAEQAIIKTVLDTPVRSARAALNGFLPDVFSLAVKAGDATTALNLASCFVLTERGGLDPTHSGRAILWTPALGFEPFSGLQPMLSEIRRRLAHADQRSCLLENLGRGERSPGKAYTLAPLQRIYRDFIDHVQKPYVQLDQASVTEALASKLPPRHLASLLQQVALRAPLTGLRRATEIAQSLTTQQQLPAWLANASINAQILHAELLQQYLNQVLDDQDYLAGIRTLPRTAHVQLKQQLMADTFDVDPDKVRIHLNESPRSAASSKTLTEFALSHFTELEQARFQVTSLDATAIPAGLNESYVKNLVRTLKLGEHHLQTIKDAVADTHADAATRRTRFYTQLPWQLMQYAHSEKLQERLSESAFDLLRQVIDMPDAIARKAVDGALAIIRPLEFSGLKSLQTVTVPGVYLIGSSSDSAAPLVLIAPYSPRHSVKEYPGESQLLAELKTRGPLFDWVLMNLPQGDKALLQQHIATATRSATPATPAARATAPVALALASTPITGHLFKRWFDDNVDLLGRLLGCQSDPEKPHEWANVTQILGGELQAAFTFMAGKLAYPLAVWRSYRDVKQSAEDLQTHKWAAAIRAFISGIAQLAALRGSLERMTLPATPETTATEAARTRFKWSDVDVTAAERTQLKPFERTDIDLGALTLDTTLGLYTDTLKTQHYAPVEGKVYAVRQHGSRWHLRGEKTHGRALRQMSSKQWTLNRDIPPPRFSLRNRLETALSVWDGMNVDAHDLPEIRRLFPQKARQIDESLDLATTYLWNSVRNLQLLKDADAETPVHTLIRQFTGMPALSPAHVEKIEKVVGEIFAAVLEPSLRKPNSKRFVVGRVIDGVANTYAFTVLTDPKQKIYLAERFFDPQFEMYRPHLTDAAFPIGTHSRAATLIHELSHLTCKTEDIAYLDSGRPFVELIRSDSEAARELRTALNELQETSLSLSTPYTRLFMLQNSLTGEWEELGATDEDTGEVKKQVLQLTGADNLAEARKLFKKDPTIRLAVQLGNADSVAWLITHLGRQLHVTAP